VRSGLSLPMQRGGRIRPRLAQPGPYWLGIWSRSPVSMGQAVDRCLPLRPQPIISARDKVEISPIAEHLKLLANLLLDVSVFRIKPAQSGFESVDIVELEFIFADALNALHDLNQPPPCLHSFLAEEQGFLPLVENGFLWLRRPISDEEDFSGFGDLIQQNIAADPSRPAGSGCQRFLSWMISRTKKCFGTTKRFVTANCFRS